MVYRPCPDPAPPSEADLDTGEMVQAAGAVERGERHLRMLAELAEIAMTLARSLGELAQARIETAKAADGALPPGEDPVAAFTKMGQTVRRTIDLEARLAEQVNTRRSDLAAARSARRAALDEAHQAGMDEAIDAALTDAFFDVYPDPKAGEIDEVLSAAENLRSEFDEFRDYVDRPVGETVARICAILNLDPTCCVKDGGTWMVRSPPHEYETARNPKTGEPDWRVKESLSTGPPP